MKVATEPTNNQSISPDTSTAASKVGGIKLFYGSNKKTILLVTVGVTVTLLIAGLLSLGSLNNKSKNMPGQSSPVAQQTSKTNKNQSFAAKNAEDFGQVCQGGIPTNATDYKTGPSPHPIVLFTYGARDSYSEEHVSFNNLKWQPSYDKVETTQLVGCFKRASQGETKKCDFDSAYGPITVDYIAATYELIIREAKTGKVVGTKEVNGPNFKCPSVVSYEKDDPKAYAHPDEGLTEEAVKEFVLR